MTWAKQLKNLRTQKEALDHLANMDVEKARPAVPALIELFKDTKRPEHLEALARYLDPRTKPIMIEALDYTRRRLRPRHDRGRRAGRHEGDRGGRRR